MKNFKFVLLAVSAVLIFSGANFVFAASGPAKAKPAAPAAKEPGQVIGDHNVKGYALHYVLLNKAEREVAMGSMLGMEMDGMINSPDVTGHFIVFIKDAAGRPVSGQVGFAITGPDKKEVKTLTMGINSGYGADVIMKAKGVYTFKLKAKVNGAKGAETLADTIVVNR